MGNIILITGGTRSGKSDYALQRGEQLGSNRCLIATCPVTDDEMAARIDKHRKQRDAAVWSTIEEPLNVDGILKHGKYDLYLVDCLTLWISNQMVDCSQSGESCTEELIAARTKQLLEAISMIEATVILVTNEVGMGVVPDNELARRYRDLVGGCNRLVAAAADAVVLVSCGLPIYLKKNGF